MHPAKNVHLGCLIFFSDFFLIDRDAKFISSLFFLSTLCQEYNIQGIQHVTGVQAYM